MKNRFNEFIHRARSGPWLALRALFLVLLSVPVEALDIQPESGNGWQNKSAVSAREFMVSAAHPLAVNAGYDTLLQGGNAIDAMVAVQMMLNLVEPQSSGIGGGAFLMYWDASRQELLSFDGRETAPAAVSSDYFLDQDGQPEGWWQIVTGGRSVGVPGTLRLLEEVHQQFGKLAWPSLLQPTIQQARQGFEVTPRLSASIAKAQDKGLKTFESTRAYFFSPDGRPLQAGSLLRNPAFANTLESIAEYGADYLYKGPLAEEVVDSVTRHGVKAGLMTLDDLHSYKVIKRDPVCIPYRLNRVCGMGPPSSGALTVGQILGIVSNFDMSGPGVEAVHIYSEAAKLAYADRNRYMADSDFVAMPTDGLLDTGYLAHRASLIDRSRAMDKAAPGAPPWENSLSYSDDLSQEKPGTSHISIVDKQGNIVSMTTTIETGFGSRLMVGGFLLNNELTDFSFVSERNGLPVANRIEGGKRPRSSMAPTIVFNSDSRPLLVLGSPGGSRIINYVANTLIAVLDWNMDIQSAINLGHFVNRNGDIDLEANTTMISLKPALEERGHTVNLRDLNSGLHGLQFLKDGSLLGGADPRREGIVKGK